MIVNHTPIPAADWSLDTARGRQRTQDMEVLTRILLPKVKTVTVIDVLSKPISAQSANIAGPEWTEFVSIMHDLGPDYTRTEHCDAMDRACRFMYGPIVKDKSDVGPNTTS